MKNFTYMSMLLTAALSFAFISCDKEDEEEGGNSAANVKIAYGTSSNGITELSDNGSVISWTTVESYDIAGYGTISYVYKYEYGYSGSNITSFRLTTTLPSAELARLAYEEAQNNEEMDDAKLTLSGNSIICDYTEETYGDLTVSKVKLMYDVLKASYQQQQ